MALNKRAYTDGTTVITAENLNEIQEAVIALENAWGGSSGGGSGESITPTITTIASGTIPSGTEANTDTDLGVYWEDINGYDWFEICIYNPTTNGMTGYWYVLPVGGNTAIWNTISLGQGRTTAIFQKLADDHYTLFLLDNVNASPLAIKEADNYAHSTRRWMSIPILRMTQYAGKTLGLRNSVATTSDMNWAITGFNYKG